MPFGIDAGTVVLNVLPNSSAFGRTLKAQVGPQVQAVETQAQGAASKLGILGAAGNAAVLTVSAGVVAGVGVAIKSASDLGESINKARVIFRDAADDVLAFADNASKVGLAKSEALDAAAGFGAMAESAGLSDRKAADLSLTMVKLAADMASFNNQDPSEMLLRLRSGLAGEAEPLRRFGVFLSEARVQQEAVNQGIAEQGDKLTDAQKVLARYSIILKDTTRQQGDFARTAGTSLANQLRVLRAETINAAAKLGQNLLPVALEVTKVLNLMLDVVGPIASQLNVLLGIALAYAALRFLPPLLFQVALGLERIGMARTANAVAGIASAFDGLTGVLKLALIPAIGGWIAHSITAQEQAKMHAEAVEHLTEVLRVQQVTIDDVRKAWEDQPDWFLDAAEDALLEAAKAAGVFGRETAGAAGAVGAASAAEEVRIRMLDRGVTASENAAMGQRVLRDAHLEAAAAARDERLAEDELAGGLLGILSAGQQAEESTRDLIQARKDLAEAERQHGKSSKEAKEAREALTEAELQAAEAQVALSSGVNDLAQSVHDGDVSMGEARDRLREIAQQAGLTKGETRALLDQLSDLIDEYKAVPPKVQTNLQLIGGGEVLDVLHQIRTSMFLLGGSTATIFVRPGGGEIGAATGFHGVVTEPTLLHVAEGGNPERVDVSPLGSVSSSPSSGDPGGVDLSALEAAVERAIVRGMDGFGVYEDGFLVGRARRRRESWERAGR